MSEPGVIMSQCDACEQEWRVWLCDLEDGEIRNNIAFVRASFEPAADGPGRGSIVFHREGIAMRDMYPRSTMIVFERLLNRRDPIPSQIDGRIPDAVADFVGIVETLSMGLDGLVTLGFNEIDAYFNYRLIRHDLFFTDRSQTEILAVLFRYGTNYSLGDPFPASINLRAFAYSSTTNRDRQYLAIERKNLGEAAQELTEVIDGPSYYVTGFRLGNTWLPSIITYDEGSPPTEQSVADFDLGVMSDVTMELDGNEQAILVDAIGSDSGGSGEPLISTVSGFYGDFPRYHARISFPDVSSMSTLTDHASGYQRSHRDLSPRIAFTIPNFLEHEASRVILPGLTRCTVRIPGRYLSILGLVDDDEPFIVSRVGWSVGPESRTSVVIEVVSTSVTPKVVSAEEVTQPLVECEEC